MEIKFTKMEGLGNDYVYFDGINQDIPLDPTFISKVSNRHIGVGSDGIIVILKSDIYDFKMRMFNADGSEAMMCGNGVRCFAKFCYDHKLTQNKIINVETKAGLRVVELLFDGSEVIGATVDMQEPIFETKEIPCIYKSDTVIDQTITVGGKNYNITALSMGNPHAVTFVDTLEFDIEAIGPLFENHPMFPNSVNTEFVQVINDSYVKMRVWERGSGETQACGTGACAVMVACHALGYCKNKVTVNLLGGDLIIEYRGNNIFMTGPAKNSFEGILNYTK